MSVIYKTTERDRGWETSSSRTGGGGGGYTTVRRYKVPDRSLEEDTYESEMRLVHRSRDDDFDRRSVKDYVIERSVEPAREVRHYHYADRDPSPQRSEYRIQREYERSPSPARTEIRISRDWEREQDIFPREQQPYELEKYSRSTEYFRPEPLPQPPPQPIYIRNEAPQPMQMQMQPIIIREEAPQPIIIRERAPEPVYEHTHEEERQVARPPPEEDYYYERRYREVDRRDRYDERQGYYSDDDVYIHKTKDTWGGSSETHTKRDIAAGALAGVAAGQVLRHHRKRKGEAAGGSIGNALGYGTLGAVSAVALDRFNNRSRSRSRSVSSDRGRGYRRNKSRHRSKSRVKELGTLAAIAGVGALAYAAGQRNKNKNKEETVTIIEDRHRSKSRSRRGRRRSRSVSVVSDRSRSRSSSKHRAAKVGLASAAVAGLAQRHRSKSRKREGKRSPSRIRKGVPIAAAGVTGAAITGLYEKRKAKKEGREASRSKSRSRSRSRSVLSRLTGRSRSRRGSTVSEPVLVEYGGDPIYTDRPARSRSRSQSRSHGRSRSRRRRRSSSSSSGGRSRSRSKGRARSVAETAAVAGVAGLAAHEATKRRDRKKAEKEAERRREEDSAYSTGTYSPYDSPTPSTAHPNDSQYFPQTNYFPPPPNVPVDHNAHAPYPPYNPADYPPGPQSAYEPNHPSRYVNPPHDDVHVGNPYAPPPQHHEPYYGQPRRTDGNVSAPVPDPVGNEHNNFASARDAVEQSRSRSSSPEEEKSVHFDLNPQEEPPREACREASPKREDSDPDDHGYRQRRRRRDDEHSHSSRESGRDRKRHHRDESPGSDASDATIELPPRFDERGRQKPEDPLAETLETVHEYSKRRQASLFIFSLADLTLSPCSITITGCCSAAATRRYACATLLVVFADLVGSMGNHGAFFSQGLAIPVYWANVASGSIYFTAQSIDSLLFQNPDLLHDLYVFKCVTTVVFTADSGGETANDTRVREIEHGLEDAYRFMSGGASFKGDGSRPISDIEEPAPSDNTTTIRIGKYDVAASPVFGMSNVQIIYLRLPGSTYYGQGYAAYHEESLKGLYSADISHITTTDGTVTYSVKNLKGVIATILRERRPNDVRVLNHLESLPKGDDDTQLQHADRIVSAKLVMDVIKEEEIEANIIT
ncbi:hypothetical protein DDE83_005208 [Stemphylium lycopersici]|uniref:DUF3824 domain-containing protein n=1 Tax=Stemphylium lycopersici TaxID=183478 RepID=A0A364N2H0_STELY|nr:hypothetical protein DDE83_005208 [Stemphylium lycopersici]